MRHGWAQSEHLKTWIVKLWTQLVFCIVLVNNNVGLELLEFFNIILSMDKCIQFLKLELIYVIMCISMYRQNVNKLVVQKTSMQICTWVVKHE